MKTYRVTLFWTMTKDVEIKADDEDEAIELASEENVEDGEYLPGSFEVSQAVEV